jgi:hypothetical protein
VPSILPVQLGTNLIAAEIAFLTKKGLDFVDRPADPVFVPKAPFLQIDVNNYPEKINLADLSNCPLFQNLKRIESAETQKLRVISRRKIAHGNGFGKLFCVCTHETEALSK